MPHTLAAKVAIGVTGFNFALYGFTADGLLDLLVSRIWMAMAVSLVAVPVAVVLTYVAFYGGGFCIDCWQRRRRRRNTKPRHPKSEEEWWW